MNESGQESDPKDSKEPIKISGAPTITQGGSMPGTSETTNTQNAYPRPDATVPGKVPAAIADSIGDPTGDRNREQLLALAEAQGLDGADGMDREELAEALKAVMDPEELFYAAKDQKAEVDS